MKTVFMPMTILVGQVLTITADWLLTFFAGVGVQALVALDAVGAVLPQNVFLAKQRLLTIMAVKAFSHFGIRGLVRRQIISSSLWSWDGESHPFING